MMEMETKLKPCPFCGGKATGETKKITRDEEDDVYSQFYRVYRVKCTECGAKTKWYKCQRLKNEYVDPNDKAVWEDGGYKKAIKKWNRRAGEND